MPPSKPPARIADLLEFLDQACTRKSWHGTNLSGSIRGMSAAGAAWRPAKNRRCPAEIIAHCAYWKYSVRRRILDEPRGSFTLAGSDWFALPTPWDEKAWRSYRKLLSDEHHAFRAAVAALPERSLLKIPAGSTVTYRFLIQGVAHHDIYHAGQIQTIKALRKSR